MNQRDAQDLIEQYRAETQRVYGDDTAKLLHMVYRCGWWHVWPPRWTGSKWEYSPVHQCWRTSNVRKSLWRLRAMKAEGEL